MTAVTPQLDDDQLDRMPAIARVLYITLLELYQRTGGEVEVFTEFDDNGAGELHLRPSNVHGEMRFVFDEHGRLVDVEWHTPGASTGLADAYMRGFRCAVSGQPYAANTGGDDGSPGWSAFNKGWGAGNRSLKRAQRLAKNNATHSQQPK